MRLADVFVGAKGSTIQQLVKKSVVIELVEISSSAEISPKLDQIKKAVSRHSKDRCIIIVFKD